MNVRISIALSDRSLRKQTMAWSHWRTSSAYSRRETKASFDASGKLPPGISMYKLLLRNVVSQLKTVWEVKGYRKVIFSGSLVSERANWFSLLIGLAFMFSGDKFSGVRTSGIRRRHGTQRHRHVRPSPFAITITTTALTVTWCWPG